MKRPLSIIFQSGLAASWNFFGGEIQIVIQDRTSLQYRTRIGNWTNNLREAMRFEHAVDARRFCRMERLGNAQIVIKSGTREPDLVLPVLG